MFFPQLYILYNNYMYVIIYCTCPSSCVTLTESNFYLCTWFVVFQFEGSKLVSCDSTGAVRTWDFAVQLMPIGNKGGLDGSIDHNVVNEKDLLRGAYKI